MTNPAATTTDPNPVVAELQPAGPPPKAAARKKVLKPKKPKGTAGAPAAGAPLPDPGQGAAPAAPSR